jgi:hypothetical protein
MDCIGAFSEMLYTYPALLGHIIPIVTSAVQSPELSLCATMALKDLTRDCTDVMGPFANDILTQCHRALSSNQLKNGECIRLMYPIGKMLSLIPQDQVMPYLERVLTPYLVVLNEISLQEPTAASKPRVIFVFKLLTCLFQSLDVAKSKEAESAQKQQPQPLTLLFPQLLPMIKIIAFKWLRDADAMDAVWTFIKQASLIGTVWSA